MREYPRLAVRTINPELFLSARMRIAARQQGLGATWDKVFENMYAGYERGLR